MHGTYWKNLGKGECDIERFELMENLRQEVAKRNKGKCKKRNSRLEKSRNEFVRRN